MDIPIDYILGYNSLPIFILAWTEGSGNSASVLRLLYQGRFLHGNTTLAGKFSCIGCTTTLKFAFPSFLFYVLVFFFFLFDIAMP